LLLIYIPICRFLFLTFVSYWVLFNVGKKINSNHETRKKAKELRSGSVINGTLRAFRAVQSLEHFESFVKIIRTWNFNKQ
jgi:hypothetical protein